MEIQISIQDNGDINFLALDTCEELLHDYRYFLQCAKDNDP